MGTIVTRKRNDGSNYYTGQIVIKSKGKVHREAQSFDRKQAANAWIVRREEELRKPGALDRAGKDPKLADVIDRYIAESEKQIGKTKAQVLRTIKDYDIAGLKCSQIGSEELLTFARSLDVEPQTRQNYLSHLSAIFAVARPAWGYPLDRQAIKDAFTVAKRLGVTAKGNSRERRPTLDELDRLMDHFGTVKARRPSSIPMQRIIAFAIFSTRRHDKIGNHTWCELVPEASAVVEAMPRRGERIFPYSTDAISAAFTRARKVLGIDDLRFHDLRHEGVSRLFEMGRTIPQVASVSGHRSWQSLQRYTHLRQVGDKYANWKWR